MGIWVSRLDAGWELVCRPDRPEAAVPSGNSRAKSPLRAVPAYELTCGAGCGYVGATGIELAMFYDHNYPELKAHPDAMPHYVFYEMGRNFYTFGDRHSCFHHRLRGLHALRLHGRAEMRGYGCPNAEGDRGRRAADCPRAG